MSNGWGKTGPDRPPRGPGIWTFGAFLAAVAGMIYFLHKIGVLG